MTQQNRMASIAGDPLTAQLLLRLYGPSVMARQYRNRNPNPIVTIGRQNGQSNLLDDDEGAASKEK